jgi:hypothetical protein
MARTAVVAGTATAVSGGIMRRQQARADQAAQAAAYQRQQEYAVASQPAATANDDDDLTAKLEKLGDLRSAGVLSDTEFTAAKARLLG